jgi:hypothetical protein
MVSVLQWLLRRAAKLLRRRPPITINVHLQVLVVVVRQEQLDRPRFRISAPES